MPRIRQMLVTTVTVLALVAIGATAATAQSRGEKPKATEIGVTATEIHIAVIADVDNPFAPACSRARPTA